MFFILVVVLSALWFFDLFQTLKMTKRFGNRIEENPFARFLLKHKPIDFTIFKIIDLLFVIGIMHFLNVQNTVIANVLLVLFILIYVLTVIHNSHVYRNIYRL